MSMPQKSVANFMSKYMPGNKGLLAFSQFQPKPVKTTNVTIEVINNDPKTKTENDGIKAAAKAEQESNDLIWETELWPAVKSKDQNKIRELKNQRKIDLLHSDKGTALMQTIREFDLESLIFLLQFGADPNVIFKTKNGDIFSAFEVILASSDKGYFLLSEEQDIILKNMLIALIIYNLSSPLGFNETFAEKLQQLQENMDNWHKRLVACRKECDKAMPWVRRFFNDCVTSEQEKRCFRYAPLPSTYPDVDIKKLSEASNIPLVCNMVREQILNMLGAYNIEQNLADQTSKRDFYKKYLSHVQSSTKDIQAQYNALLSTWQVTLKKIIDILGLQQIILGYVELRQEMLNECLHKKDDFTFLYKDQRRKDRDIRTYSVSTVLKDNIRGTASEQTHVLPVAGIDIA